MDGIAITLRVGDKLTLELPDGRMATCTVGQIAAASGYSESWVTNTPRTGDVTLTLQPTGPRTGEWAQQVSDGTPTLRAGTVIEAPASLAEAIEDIEARGRP